MALQTNSAENFLEKIDTNETNKNVINDKEILAFLENSTNHQAIKDQMKPSNLNVFCEGLKKYTISGENEKTDQARDAVEKFFKTEAGKNILWKNEEMAKSIVMFDLLLEKSVLKNGKTAISDTDYNNIRLNKENIIDKKIQEMRIQNAQKYLGKKGEDISSAEVTTQGIEVQAGNNKILIPLNNNNFTVEANKTIKYKEGSTDKILSTYKMPDGKDLPVVVVEKKAYLISFGEGKIDCKLINDQSNQIIKEKLDKLQTKLRAYIDGADTMNIDINSLEAISANENNQTFAVKMKSTSGTGEIIIPLNANFEAEGQILDNNKIDFSQLGEKIYKKTLEKYLDPSKHLFIKTETGSVFSIAVNSEQEKLKITEYIVNLEDDFGDQNNQHALHGSGTEAVANYVRAMDDFISKYKGKQVSEIFQEANREGGGMYIDEKNAWNIQKQGSDETFLGMYASISKEEDISSHIQSTRGSKLLNIAGNSALSLIPGIKRWIAVDTANIKEKETKKVKVYTSQELRSGKGKLPEFLKTGLQDYSTEGRKKRTFIGENVADLVQEGKDTEGNITKEMKKNIVYKQGEKTTMNISPDGFISIQDGDLEDASNAQKLIKIDVNLSSDVKKEAFLPVKKAKGPEWSSLENIAKTIPGKLPISYEADGVLLRITDKGIFAIGVENDINNVLEKNKKSAEITNATILLIGLILPSLLYKNWDKVANAAGTSRDGLGSAISSIGKGGKNTGEWLWPGIEKIGGGIGNQLKSLNTFSKGTILGAIVGIIEGEWKSENMKRKLAEAESQTTGSYKVAGTLQGMKEFESTDTELPEQLQKRLDNILNQKNNGDYLGEREFVVHAIFGLTENNDQTRCEVIDMKKQADGTYLVYMDNKKEDRLLNKKKESQRWSLSFNQTGKKWEVATIEEPIVPIDGEIVDQKNTQEKIEIDGLTLEEKEKTWKAELDNSLNPKTHIYIARGDQIYVLNIKNSDLNKIEATKQRVEKTLANLETTFGNDKQGVAAYLYAITTIFAEYEAKPISQVYKEVQSRFTSDVGLSQGLSDNMLDSKGGDREYLGIYQKSINKNISVLRAREVTGWLSILEGGVNAVVNTATLGYKEVDMANIESDKDYAKDNVEVISAKDRWEKKQGRSIKNAWMGGEKPFKESKITESDDRFGNRSAVEISKNGIIAMYPERLERGLNGNDIGEVNVVVEGQGTAILSVTKADYLAGVMGISEEELNTITAGKGPLTFQDNGIMYCINDGKIYTVNAPDNMKSQVQSKRIEISPKLVAYTLSGLINLYIFREELLKLGESLSSTNNSKDPENVSGKNDISLLKKVKDWANNAKLPSGVKEMLSSPVTGVLVGKMLVSFSYQVQASEQKTKLANFYSQLENGPAVTGFLESTQKTDKESIDEVKAMFDNPTEKSRVKKPKNGLDFGLQKRTRLGHLLAYKSAKNPSLSLSVSAIEEVKTGDVVTGYKISFDDGSVGLDKKSKEKSKEKNKETILSVGIVDDKIMAANTVNTAINTATNTVAANTTETTKDNLDIQADQIKIEEPVIVPTININSTNIVDNKTVNNKTVNNNTTDNFQKSAETAKDNLDIQVDQIKLKERDIDKSVIASAINAIQNLEIKKQVIEIAKKQGKAASKELQAYIVSQGGKLDVTSRQNVKNGDFDGYIGASSLAGIASLQKIPAINDTYKVSRNIAENRKKLVIYTKDPTNPKNQALLSYLQKGKNNSDNNYA